MTCQLAANQGHRTWSSTRDAEGNREYRIKFRVESDDPLDGPAVVRETPGLFTVGASWAWDNDSDPWAFCLPTDNITQVEEGELIWDVEQTFSSKPLPPGQQRCNDQKIEDPLMEPPKVSGGSTKYSEEAPYDRFGNPVCSSSWEPIRGQVNEWDANRSSIRIEVNVMSFAQVTFALSMRDCVNMFPMWGFAARCIKLSNINWERKYYGLCYVYYTVVMEFDTNPATFDRNIMDEGHKCLKGHWDGTTGDFVLDYIGTGSSRRGPNPRSPSDFIRIPDREGNPTRMVLNGYGLPACTRVRYDSEMYNSRTAAALGPTDDRYVNISVISGTDNVSPTVDIGTWLQVTNLDFWAGGFPPTWGPLLGLTHDVGAIVAVGAQYYVALEQYPVEAPESGDSAWLAIPFPTDAGVWSANTTYGPGQMVQVNQDPVFVGTSSNYINTRIGVRRVEKYNEANFIALGLPLTF